MNTKIKPVVKPANWKSIDGFDNYEINTSGLVRNKDTNRIFKNNIDRGYYRVGLSINGKRYTKNIHRLLALAFIPNPLNKKCVDHIDGNRLNNNLSNLRWATDAENNHNAKKKCNNTSGYKGIHWHKQSNKWHARIQLNDKRIHVGSFDDINKAVDAIKKKRKELHKDFSNHGN